jgi:adenosylcobyric acid synthase
VSGHPLFVGGTSSNAGKSWMVTAICAWLRSKGVSVAPFKAQNMSNHSYPCAAGGEIGRAQVAQAEACGIEPEPSMNPILLKPSGNGVSQVIVQGRMWKTLAARDYYKESDVLRSVVLDAYHDLARRFDVIVIEGAGSVSELNLRPHDLVNLWLVTALRAPWVLVADIERGGVFASIVGSASLLDREERGLFRGFMINKFRGDVSLFDDAVPMLESRTASLCYGVFPYADDIHVDAEDSLALDTRPRSAPPPGAAIAIVRLPHVSNATDFRLLTWADWITAPTSGHYDFIVLPGTKNTIADLAWLRGNGLADWILARHKAGATVVGICGGFQMLGDGIEDPTGVEGSTTRAEGLRLVRASTVLMREKRTRLVKATLAGGSTFGAYEIHVGATTLDRSPGATPFARLDDGSMDGIWTTGVVGTYLHGALEHPEVCTALFGVTPQDIGSKAEHYRRLGRWFDRHQRHFGELDLV